MRWFLWLGAIVFIVYASLLPFSFVADLPVVESRWNEALRRSASGEWVNLSRADLLQNVLLFVPMGVFGAAALSRVPSRLAALGPVIVATLVSTTCEALQLLTTDRLTSVWDIGANVFGTSLGVGLAFIAAPVAARASMLRPVSDTDRQRLLPVLAASALVLLSATEPFDITIDVGTTWTKVKALVEHPLSAEGPFTDELFTALRYATLSYLLCRAVRDDEQGGEAGRMRAAASCFTTATALEAAQLLIESRSPHVRDLLFAALGIAIGIVTEPRLVGRLGATKLLFTATAVAAIPYYLQPFDLAKVHATFATMPFLAYYQFTSLQTVSHVIGLMLIYAPLGFAMIWNGRSKRLAHVLWVIGITAGAFEYGQAWIVGRYPDVTDVGMALLGAWAGAAVATQGLDWAYSPNVRSLGRTATEP